MATPLRVLIVEDSEDDALLVSEQLKKADFDVVYKLVETAAAMRAALGEDRWDIILSDFSLPLFSGREALNILKQTGLDIPFILVSGAVGEEMAVELMRSGAHDYIMKGNVARLVPSVRRELAEARLRVEKRKVEDDLKRSYERLEKNLNAAVETMGAITEQRDPSTAGHQVRVAKLACALAEELELDESRVKIIRIGAVLHDIGKVNVPAEILAKPGRLNAMEFELVKGHPQVGFDIVRKIEFPAEVAEMIWQHHERLDGSGYPRGLMGKQIILEARILGISDVVEAMSSHRPYRPALGIEKAIEHLLEGAGTLYDREIAEACARLVKERRFQFD